MFFCIPTASIFRGVRLRNIIPQRFQPRMLATQRSASQRSQIRAPRAALSDVFNPQVAMSRLQKHIEDGLELIKEGNYEGGMEHFYNRSFLQSLKLNLIHGKFFPVEQIPTKKHEIEKALRQVHDKNWYHSSGSIELAQLAFIKKGQPVLPTTPAEETALKQLQHEQALMYAEEHIHALQAMKKGNITFSPSSPVPHADEVDIATTLAHYNVPLTEAFLKRYNRAAHVPNYRTANYN